MKKQIKYFTLFLFFFALIINVNAYCQKENKNEINAQVFEEEEEEKINFSNFDLMGISEAQKTISKKVKYYTGVPNIKWKERGPNNVGGVVKCLMFDPNDAQNKKVWAGTLNGGVWYTNDISNKDSSWYKVSDFWENINISSLTYDPINLNIYYASTGTKFNAIAGNVASGIYKSIDKGKNWYLLESTRPSYSLPFIGFQESFQNISKLTVNKLGHLFAATKKGLLKSTDGGNTWVTAISNISFFDVEIGVGSTMFSGTNNSDIPNEDNQYVSLVYKSIDNGLTWNDITPISAPNKKKKIATQIATSGQILYIKYNTTLYKSNDLGNTWELPIVTPPSSGIYNATLNSLSVDPLNSNIIFSGDQMFHRSIDGGKIWSSGSSKPHWDINEILIDTKNPKRCIIASDGGVHISDSMRSGTNYEFDLACNSAINRNKGLSVTQITHLAMPNDSNSNIIAFSTNHNSSQFMNNPLIGSISEKDIFDGNNAGINYGEANQLFFDQNNPNLFIFQDFFSNKTDNVFIFNSFNNWQSNRQIRKMPGTLYYNSNNNKLYSYSRILRKLFITSNVGSTNDTTSINLNLPIYNSLIEPITTNVLKINHSKNSAFFVRINKLFRVNLANPSPITPESIFESPAGNITNFEISEDGNQIIVLLNSPPNWFTDARFINYGYNKIYYSSDGGLTWENKHDINSGLPPLPVFCAIFNPNNNNQLLIGTELGVWGTNDISTNSTKWELANTNLANVKIMEFSYRKVDTLLLVGTYGRGIFSSNVFRKTNRCYSPLTLNNLHEAGNYRSNNIISTSYVGGTNNSVKYFANRIELKPGFKVNNNAIFRSYLEGCDPNARTADKYEYYPIVPETPEDNLAVYPNPVENKEFNVDYTVVTKGNVNIQISTSDGKIVKSIIENKFHESGKYSIKVNTDGINEGLYLCILTGNSLLETKKIIIK